MRADVGDDIAATCQSANDADRGPTTVTVTGAYGFLGTRFRLFVEERGRVDVRPLGRGQLWDDDILAAALHGANAVVHFAGVNRSDDDDELFEGNVELARRVVDGLEGVGGTPQVVFASSTQALGDLETPYAKGKRGAAQTLADWARRTGGTLSVLYIPNVFGPGCRPFYNSVVATACHQLWRGEQPRIIDDRVISLVHSDDVAAVAYREATADLAGGSVRDIRWDSGKLTSIRVSALFVRLTMFRDRLEVGEAPETNSRFEDQLLEVMRSYRPSDAVVAEPTFSAPYDRR